ncbi:MAG: MarR family transcriptional regulator [Gammaproteobacteria bacterium]|nr:MarR family transcriptional regulator [Gammaproteobacteria bacterium]
MAKRQQFSVRRPLPLEESILFKLAVAVNLNASVFHQQYARRHDLTLTDWRVLATLVSHPGISAREVSEIIAVDKMSITRAVQRLLRRGRIRATSNSRDRRRLALSVAPRGAVLYDRIVPDAGRHQERCLQDLSVAERAALDRLLSKVIARARGMKAPAAGGRSV